MQTKQAFSILIVDDEPGIRDFLYRSLSSRYTRVETAESTSHAEALRRQEHFDLLIVDIRMPGQTGIEWLSSIEVAASSALIVMTGYAELDAAIDVLRLGAMDFIHKPFRLEQMQASVARACKQLQLARENTLLRRRLFGTETEPRLIGDTPAMHELRDLVVRVAPLPSAVLVEGETGTGKEMVASALHQYSSRTGHFVPVNCGAISAELIESELFGHIKGAYTGAEDSRQGLFGYADGGTLFLDEIAEMPLALQTKLLRVLEEGRIRPVGSEQAHAVDVRIVAACNKPLQQAVKAGTFREDLFYRLNVLPLQLPPLRQRQADIPALASHLNQRLAEDLGVPMLPLSHEDYRAMQNYSWPGNVRELRNLIERCMLLNCLPAALLTQPSANLASGGYPLDWTLEQVELEHMRRVLERCQGNKQQAAEQLGVSSKTLSRRLPSRA